MRPIHAVVLAAALLATLPVFAAGFSTLEEQMSEAQFKSAGLDRLSAEELANLNAWLAQRNLLPQSGAAAGGDGFKSRNLLGNDGDSERVVSRATSTQDEIGVGSTITLENGQAWKITEGSLSLSGSVAGRQVTVSPAVLGSWLLKVEGYNRALRATRIR